jgi:hypothetical protein
MKLTKKTKKHVLEANKALFPLSKIFCLDCIPLLDGE